MKQLTATTTLTLALLALAGCGGDSEGESAGAVSSGISTTKALSAVSAQEATQGCEHMQDAVEARFQKPSVRTGMCTLFAATLSSSESACTSLRDSCLKGESGAGASSLSLDPAQDFECSAASVDGWQGCAATVGEMETCLNDMLNAFDAMLSAATCKNAGTLQADSSEDCIPPPIDPNGHTAIDPNTGRPYVDPCADSQGAFASPSTPKSCQALQSKCPSLDMFGE